MPDLQLCAVDGREGRGVDAEANVGLVSEERDEDQIWLFRGCKAGLVGADGREEDDAHVV